MASGIEVAGLVLGAFPIVMKALSSVVEGLEKIEDMRRARNLLTQYCEIPSPCYP